MIRSQLFLILKTVSNLVNLLRVMLKCCGTEIHEEKPETRNRNSSFNMDIHKYTIKNVKDDL